MVFLKQKIRYVIENPWQCQSAAGYRHGATKLLRSLSGGDAIMQTCPETTFKEAEKDLAVPKITPYHQTRTKFPSASMASLC